MCVKVLSGKALCQVDPDQADDEEAAEELAELDSVLISSCEDVISALASVVGQEFVNAFGTFLPLISQYYVRIIEVFTGSLLTCCLEGSQTSCC